MFRVRRLNSIKTLIRPKLMYRLKGIPIKSSAGTFGGVTTEKLILQFIRKCKNPTTDKITLRKNNKVEGLILPDFKKYYKSWQCLQYSDAQVTLQMDLISVSKGGAQKQEVLKLPS